MKDYHGGKGIGFWLALVGAGLTALTVGFLIWAAVCPVNALEPSVLYSSSTADTVNISWPKNGAAAIGTLDEGLKSTHGSSKPQPTASIAKIITVLVVLEKYPLKKGESGPTITVTGMDVKEWERVVAQDGSNIRVIAGEKLTERQMLQGILLESANNLADSLAEWAYGSLANYKTAAESWLAKHNLKHTSIGSDASGYDPATKSTPADLFELGVLALKDPVVAEIVKTKSVDFPIVGEIDNTNRLLERDASVVGVKTGSTDEAGYCLLFAATRTVGEHGQTVTVVGIVTGQETGAERFKSAESLINSAFSSLREWQVVDRGQIIGQYISPWGVSSPVIANNVLRAISWHDTPPTPKISLQTLKTPSKSGQVVGTIRVNDRLVNAVLADDLPSPTLRQKLQMTLHGQK